MYAADALQTLSSLLYSPDRAVLQLLHVLNWQPVLQQVTPIIHHMQASDAATSSLLDSDTGSGPPGLGQAASGHLQSVKSLDARAKAWAAHLMMLLLPAYVMMAESALPAWLQRLINQDPQTPDGGESPQCLPVS